MDENTQKKCIVVMSDAALNLLALFHEFTADLKDSPNLDEEVFRAIDKKKRWLEGTVHDYNFKTETKSFKELTRAMIENGDVSGSPFLAESTTDADARNAVFNFTKKSFDKNTNVKHPERFQDWINSRLIDYREALAELAQLAGRNEDFVTAEYDKLKDRL
jgi:hypothetical protein